MKLSIDSIRCNTPKSKTDKVFLTHQSDAGVPVRYPATGVYKMQAGTVWNPVGNNRTPEVVFEFTDGAYLSLWTEDWPMIVFIVSGDKTNGSPKILGNNYYLPTSQSGSASFEGNNGSSYTVNVTIEQS